MIARRIIEHSNGGEHDPVRLQESALDGSPKFQGGAMGPRCASSQMKGRAIGPAPVVSIREVFSTLARRPLGHQSMISTMRRLRGSTSTGRLLMMV